MAGVAAACPLHLLESHTALNSVVAAVARLFVLCDCVHVTVCVPQAWNEAEV